MKRFFFLTALMLATLTSMAQDRPKLVVGIAVDQMRWDYLYRYYDEYTDGGFKRLMDEGYNFENCMINYIPSVTAIGHTSLFTGSVPSIHGIAGNNFYIKGKSVYCCEDPDVQTVGSETKAGMRSPRNLLVTTIGDELRTATNWQAKLFGVSYKDRAAIFPSGHSSNAAYWFDEKANGFITSTYYMSELPEWVKEYNSGIKKLPLDDIQYTPYGNEIVVEMAKEIILNEKLGKSQTTDMLTISFSCPDKVGHKFGTHDPKTHDQYVGLDKQLAAFFTFLDKQIGKGQYLVFLSADHGAANSVQLNLDHRLPTGLFRSREILGDMNKHLTTVFGKEMKYGNAIQDYRVVINHSGIKEAGLDECKVREEMVNFLKEKDCFSYVVDLEKVMAAPIPAVVKEKIVNGYNRERSGEIQLIPKPGYLGSGGYGTSHGLWNPYDCHLPFLLMGWGVKHGTSQRACYITDIAPTVCALIHIQMPNGCIGNPLDLK